MSVMEKYSAIILILSVAANVVLCNFGMVPSIHTSIPQYHILQNNWVPFLGHSSSDGGIRHNTVKVTSNVKNAMVIGNTANVDTHIGVQNNAAPPGRNNVQSYVNNIPGNVMSGSHFDSTSNIADQVRSGSFGNTASRFLSGIEVGTANIGRHTGSSARLQTASQPSNNFAHTLFPHLPPSGSFPSLPSVPLPEQLGVSSSTNSIAKSLGMSFVHQPTLQRTLTIPSSSGRENKRHRRHHVTLPVSQLKDRGLSVINSLTKANEINSISMKLPGSKNSTAADRKIEVIFLPLEHTNSQMNFSNIKNEISISNSPALIRNHGHPREVHTTVPLREALSAGTSVTKNSAATKNNVKQTFVFASTANIMSPVKTQHNAPVTTTNIHNHGTSNSGSHPHFHHGGENSRHQASAKVDPSAWISQFHNLLQSLSKTHSSQPAPKQNKLTNTAMSPNSNHITQSQATANNSASSTDPNKGTPQINVAVVNQQSQSKASSNTIEKNSTNNSEPNSLAPQVNVAVVSQQSQSHGATGGAINQNTPPATPEAQRRTSANNMQMNQAVVNQRSGHGSGQTNLHAVSSHHGPSHNTHTNMAVVDHKGLPRSLLDNSLNVRSHPSDLQTGHNTQVNHAVISQQNNPIEISRSQSSPTSVTNQGHFADQVNLSVVNQPQSSNSGHTSGTLGHTSGIFGHASGALGHMSGAFGQGQLQTGGVQMNNAVVSQQTHANGALGSTDMHGNPFGTSNNVQGRAQTNSAVVNQQNQRNPEFSKTFDVSNIATLSNEQVNTATIKQTNVSPNLHQSGHNIGVVSQHGTGANSVNLAVVDQSNVQPVAVIHGPPTAEVASHSGISNHQQPLINQPRTNNIKEVSTSFKQDTKNHIQRNIHPSVEAGAMSSFHRASPNQQSVSAGDPGGNTQSLRGHPRQPMSQEKRGQQLAQQEKVPKSQRGQSRTPEQHSQPNTQKQHGQQGTQGQHTQPSIQGQHGEPWAQEQQELPRTQRQNTQPSSEGQHGQPGTQQRGQTSTQEHGQLGTQVQNTQLSTKGQHGQPWIQRQLEQPGSKRQHHQHRTQEQPNAHLQNDQPMTHGQFSQPSAHGQHGQSGIQGHHGEPGTLGHHMQPRARELHGQPAVGERHGELRAQEHHGQPGTQKQHGQPETQGQHGQPGIKIQFNQPSTQGQNGQPWGQKLHGTPRIHEQHSQLSTQQQHTQPGKQGQHEQRKVQGQHGLPKTQEQRGLPGTEIQHGQPGTQEQHGQPGTQVQFSQPSTQGHHGQPWTQEQPRQPGIQEQHNQRRTQGQHWQPGTQEQFNEPSTQGQHWTAGAQGHHGQPRTHGQRVHPEAQIQHNQPATQRQHIQPNTQRENGQPGTQGQFNQLSTQGQQWITGSQGHHGQPRTHGQRVQPEAQIQHNQPATQRQHSQPNTQREHGQPGTQGQFNQPSTQGQQWTTGSQGHHGQPWTHGQRVQPEAQIQHNQPATRGQHSQPNTQKEHRQLGTQGQFNQPSTQGQHWAPSSQGHHGQPWTHGQRVQPEAQIQHNQPATQGQHSQPNTQKEHRQLGTQGQFNQPSTQGQHWAPSSQGHHGQPGTQGQRVQPEAQIQNNQPATQGQHSQPNTQKEHRQPGTQGQFSQPDTQGQHWTPGSQGHHGQPGIPGQQGQPETQRQHNQPGTQRQHGQPGTQEQHSQPNTQREHGQPWTQGQFNQPSTQGQQWTTGLQGHHWQPGTQGQRVQPEAQIQHNQPAAQGQHSQPNTQKEHRQPGTQGQFNQPGTQRQHWTPGSQGHHGQPGTPGQQGQQEAQRQHNLPGTQRHHGQAGTQEQHSQPNTQREHGQPGTQGRFNQPSTQGQQSTTGLQGHHGQPVTQRQHGQPATQGQHSQPNTQREHGLPVTQGQNGQTGTQVKHSQPSTKGQPGTQGKPGSQGHQRQLGVQGQNKQLGTQGQPEIHGQQGEPGTQGQQGAQDRHSQLGIQGQNGQQITHLQQNHSNKLDKNSSKPKTHGKHRQAIPSAAQPLVHRNGALNAQTAFHSTQPLNALDQWNLQNLNQFRHPGSNTIFIVNQFVDPRHSQSSSRQHPSSHLGVHDSQNHRKEQPNSKGISSPREPLLNTIPSQGNNLQAKKVLTSQLSMTLSPSAVELTSGLKPSHHQTSVNTPLYQNTASPVTSQPQPHSNQSQSNQAQSTTDNKSSKQMMDTRWHLPRSTGHHENVMSPQPDTGIVGVHMNQQKPQTTQQEPARNKGFSLPPTSGTGSQTASRTLKSTQNGALGGRSPSTNRFPQHKFNNASNTQQLVIQPSRHAGATNTEHLPNQKSTRNIAFPGQGKQDLQLNNVKQSSTQIPRVTPTTEATPILSHLGWVEPSVNVRPNTDWKVILDSANAHTEIQNFTVPNQGQAHSLYKIVEHVGAGFGQNSSHNLISTDQKTANVLHLSRTNNTHNAGGISPFEQFVSNSFVEYIHPADRSASTSVSNTTVTGNIVNTGSHGNRIKNRERSALPGQQPLISSGHTLNHQNTGSKNTVTISKESNPNGASFSIVTLVSQGNNGLPVNNNPRTTSDHFQSVGDFISFGTNNELRNKNSGNTGLSERITDARNHRNAVEPIAAPSTPPSRVLELFQEQVRLANQHPPYTINTGKDVHRHQLHEIPPANTHQTTG